MTNNYLLEGDGLGAKVLYTFTEDWLLIKFELFPLEDSIAPKIFNWIINNVPTSKEGLEGFKEQIKNSKKLSLKKVEPNLSFEAFWDAYDYKKGKLDSVKRVWNDMPTPDRAAAMEYIKKYNYFLLENPNQSRLYPQTYLRRREWAN